MKLEANVKERFEQLEAVTACTGKDLETLAKKLDEYTKATENAVSEKITYLDAGMVRLESGLKELHRVDGDVKATVDQYYTANGIHMKEMDAKIRQHKVQIQALDRRAGQGSGGCRWWIFELLWNPDRVPAADSFRRNPVVHDASGAGQQ